MDARRVGEEGGGVIKSNGRGGDELVINLEISSSSSLTDARMNDVAALT